MKIVFMGTPEFAVPTLQRIVDDGHTVEAVITQPDKPQGRGYKLVAPPVKQLAEKLRIPVFQPPKMRDGEAYGLLQKLKPDLIVVVAYGKILPKEILDLPPLGCINVHASLLPKYRGAGPVQWSVIHGEAQTGVTTMFMAEGLDTGDMLQSMATPIQEQETAGELLERLSLLGAQCLSSTLQAVEQGTIQRQMQDDALSCYAPMLTKELGRLDFSKTAQELHCLIRGVSPWPVATALLEGKVLKVHRAAVVAGNATAGTLLESKHFVVACGTQALELLEVQAEGGKRMRGEDFLRGKPLQAGTKPFTPWTEMV